MKWNWKLPREYRNILFGIGLIFVFFVTVSLSFYSFAESDDLPDTPISETTPEYQSVEDYADTEMPEVPESAGNTPELSVNENAAEYPGALGTPYDWPEWLGEEPTDNGPMPLENSSVYEDENAAQLSRIEYHLSVISGGVVLAVCSAFIWFTILKPIKQFIVF